MIAAAALLVFAISLLVALGHLLAIQNIPLTPADTILLFGTGVAWKAQARWTHAAKLFNQGLARNIIASGGVQVPQIRLTEAEWFQQQLAQQGIPADKIFIENQAKNTTENIEFILPFLKQHDFRTVILVMSDYTGRYAHLSAKKAWQGKGIKIYDSHAPSRGHWNAWTWWLTVEGRQLTWYAVSRIIRSGLLLYL